MIQERKGLGGSRGGQDSPQTDPGQRQGFVSIPEAIRNPEGVEEGAVHLEGGVASAWEASVGLRRGEGFGLEWRVWAWREVGHTLALGWVGHGTWESKVPRITGSLTHLFMDGGALY